MIPLTFNMAIDRNRVNKLRHINQLELKLDIESCQNEFNKLIKTKYTTLQYITMKFNNNKSKIIVDKRGHKNDYLSMYCVTDIINNWYNKEFKYNNNDKHNYISPINSIIYKYIVRPHGSVSDFIFDMKLKYRNKPIPRYGALIYKNNIIVIYIVPDKSSVKDKMVSASCWEYTWAKVFNGNSRRGQCTDNELTHKFIDKIHDNPLF